MKRVVVSLIAVALALAFAAPLAAAQASNGAAADGPRVLEAVFVHYDHPAKPVKPGTEPPPAITSHYELIGPAWDLGKYPDGIPYVVNPSGAPAGAEQEVIAAFEAWDKATGRELFSNDPGVNYDSWWGQEDGKNNVSWQVLGSGSIIAGTWIWYLDKDNSGSMTAGDEVIENDIVFNASMRWGIDADGEGTGYALKRLFDVRNIATHEIGHVVGLDDLYDLSYRNITMYGYAAKSETKKISLESGDILGAMALYH